MLIKKSQLAKLCGVKPPSISGLIEKGTLHVTDGRIDLDDVANLSYLAKHNSAAAGEYQTTGIITGVIEGKKQPKTPPKPAIERDMAKKLATIRAEEQPEPDDTPVPFDPFASLSASSPARRRVPGSEDDGDAPSGAGLTDAEIAETLRKPLYDARKAKLAAEREAVNLDILHQSLGEREVFESFILELWQSMQRNYIDVAPKQAALVCKRLGMVGHELEVIEVLEGDIKKRQDNVAHEVKSILDGRLTQKVIDDAEVEG
jgi:hypothetical protein